MGRRAAPLLALLLLACASAEERFAEHRTRAEGYVAQGELEKALLEYHSALKIHPDDADLNERIGDLLVERRAPRDAAFYYREARRLDPERSRAALKEARALLPGDREGARRLVRQVLDRDAGDADAQRALSEVEVARDQLDEALAAAQRASELAPEEAESWMQLGHVRARMLRRAQLAGEARDELFESALEAFARAEQVANGHVGARIDTGRIFAAWGRRAQAERSYRDAIELAVGRSDRREQVIASGALVRQAARWRDAELERWALRRLLSAAEGRLDAWQRLAALAEDAEAAEGVYRELLDRRGDDPNAHVVYVNFLNQSDRGDDSAAHIEQVLEDGIQSPILWELLLRVRLAQGRMAEARATLVRMTDAYPEAPATRRGEARLALATGRVEEAARKLRRLLRVDDSFESLRLLARVEQRLGNLERARAAIDSALARGPLAPREALELKASIHQDAGEWKESLATLDAMVAGGLELPGSSLVMRGIALYELGQRDAGRRALLAALESRAPGVGAAVEYARREGARDPEGSLRHLQAAFQRHPASRSVLEELTARDLDGGRGDEALERLNQVIAQHRVAPAILRLRAGLLAGRGAYDAAEADALRAFEIEPRSAETLDLLFQIYVAQGRAEEAARSFEEAEGAGLLHEGARLLLARLALHAGDAERARRQVEKVLEDHSDMASAQSDLAFLLAREGREPERALALAQQARQELERDPGVAYRLGYVYLKGGRPEEALSELRRASELAERRRRQDLGPAIHYRMGLALRALDRHREALEAFESALALDPDFPEAADVRRQIQGLRRAGSPRA